MYEVVRWLPDGSAKYWMDSSGKFKVDGSFSHNPFNASKLTLESAGYVRQHLLEQGYSPDDIEIVPA